MKQSIQDEVGKVIRRLGYSRLFQHEDKKITVALLVREEDWKPLDAPWWRGKQVRIIGADIEGSFLLGHCDGSVRLWNHALQSDEIIAPSIRAFISKLEEE